MRNRRERERESSGRKRKKFGEKERQERNGESGEQSTIPQLGAPHFHFFPYFTLPFISSSSPFNFFFFSVFFSSCWNMFLNVYNYRLWGFFPSLGKGESWEGRQRIEEGKEDRELKEGRKTENWRREVGRARKSFASRVTESKYGITQKMTVRRKRRKHKFKCMVRVLFFLSFFLLSFFPSFLLLLSPCLICILLVIYVDMSWWWWIQWSSREEKEKEETRGQRLQNTRSLPLLLLLFPFLLSSSSSSHFSISHPLFIWIVMRLSVLMMMKNLMNIFHFVPSSTDDWTSSGTFFQECHLIKHTLLTFFFLLILTFFTTEYARNGTEKERETQRGRRERENNFFSPNIFHLDMWGGWKNILTLLNLLTLFSLTF